MKHDTRRIWLVGIPGDLPGPAKTAQQGLKVGIVAHGAGPAERPLDRPRRGLISLLSKKCCEQPVTRGVTDADILGRSWKIFDIAGGLARCDADRVGDSLSRQSQQL